MHEYSYNSVERRKWTVWLTLISIAAVGGLNWIIASAGEQFSWLLTVQPPSTMAIFAGLHKLFVNTLWRKKLMQKFGIVSVPDLEGRWEGHLVSSFTNEPGQTLEESDQKPVEVRITQTWTHIRISWRTDESSSASEVASIVRHDKSSCVLHYEYNNEPEELGVETMDSHRGTVILDIGENELNGRYYTNRTIPTKGRVFLKRDV